MLSNLIRKMGKATPGHAIREMVVAAPGLLRGKSAIVVDYPPDQKPRHGYALEGPHPELFSLLDRSRDEIAGTLASFLEFKDDLSGVVKTREELTNVSDPYWVNGYLPGLDAVALHGFISKFKPRTYLEIGSGHSTRFARRAISRRSPETRLISIDPCPRSEIDAICDQVIRKPLEEADLGIFEQLEAGDILFFDGSHRVFTNSDVTVFFLEVLPRLKSGVHIEIHDIYLPWDYPPEVAVHSYSEQYLLATLLLFAAEKFKPLLPNAFISRDERLLRVLDPLWPRSNETPGVSGTEMPAVIERFGGSFWLTKQSH